MLNRKLAGLGVLALLVLAACSSSAATPGVNYNANQGNISTTDQKAALGGAQAASTAAPVPAASSAPYAPGANSLIVKTGQLDLQVSDPEGASAQANGIVTTAGGYTAGSSRSGAADSLDISITYRIPVDKWDATLNALHHAAGTGTIKILDEQIQTQDVTAQAVDLDARLTNLHATEQTLLAIMARAGTIADTLAVETQLSDVRGQIEQLQAQRNQIGDQASMSTLTVQFMATPKTETTTATNNWDFGQTVDDATAALVKVGQSAATALVWLVIVGLPILLGLAVLYLVYRLTRRLRRRTTKKTIGGPATDETISKD
jgi:hypothetical protein